MFIAMLIVLNIPLYLLLGWILFDTSKTVTGTVVERVLSILKGIGQATLMGLYSDDDDDDEYFESRHFDIFNAFPAFAFYFTCAAITYGEYWLIHKYCL